MTTPAQYQLTASRVSIVAAALAILLGGLALLGSMAYTTFLMQPFFGNDGVQTKFALGVILLGCSVFCKNRLVPEHPRYWHFLYRACVFSAIGIAGVTLLEYRLNNLSGIDVWLNKVAELHTLRVGHAGFNYCLSIVSWRNRATSF